MNRNVMSIVAGALALTCVGTSSAVTLRFVPDPLQTMVADVAELGLEISDLGDLSAPSLGAFDVDVLFDPAIVAVDNVVFGDPLLGDQLDLFDLGANFTGVETPAPGVLRIFELSLDLEADLNDLQQSRFVLARISFEALSVGSTALGLTVNALSDAAGSPLTPVDFDPGVITVRGPDATLYEPGAIDLVLASSLGVVMAIRRRRCRARGSN